MHFRKFVLQIVAKTYTALSTRTVVLKVHKVRLKVQENNSEGHLMKKVLIRSVSPTILFRKIEGWLLAYNVLVL